MEIRSRRQTRREEPEVESDQDMVIGIKTLMEHMHGYAIGKTEELEELDTGNGVNDRPHPFLITIDICSENNILLINFHFWGSFSS